MKRLISFILALCLIFICTACQKPQIESITTTGEEEGIKTAPNLTEIDKMVIPYQEGKIDNALYNKALLKSGYKYNTIETYNDDGSSLVYAAPLSELEKLYLGREIDKDWVNTYKPGENSIEQIEENAKIIFETMTKTNAIFEEGVLKTFISWSGNDYDIFDGFDPTFDGAESEYSTFLAENLKLDFTDIEVQKLMGSEQLAKNLWTVIAQVKATVTCQSKGGQFKDVAWIPENPGDAKDMVFSVSYSNIRANESFAEFKDVNYIMVRDIEILEGR